MRVAIVFIPSESAKDLPLTQLSRLATESGWELHVEEDSVAAGSRLAELAGGASAGSETGEPGLNGAGSRLLRVAELLEREQTARAQADSARRRSAFLADASATLASSEATASRLASIARRATVEIADYCAIRLLRDAGAVCSVLSDKLAESADGSSTLATLDLLAGALSEDVVHSGRAAFYPFVPEDILSAFTRTDEERESVRGLGVSSIAVAPLNVADAIIGTVALIASDPGRHFTIDDLEMAEELAGRLATSIENERLCEQLRGQSELLQVTLASIGDAVIAADCQGRVTFMNEVAEAWTGWNQTDAIGRSIEEVLELRHVGSPESLPSPVARVLQFGAVVGHDAETEMITSDGSAIPVEESAAPIRDADGAIHGVVTVLRDVAERRRAEHERAIHERELSIERGRISSLMQSVPGIVWEWWSDSEAGEAREDFVSDYASAMLGLTERERTPSMELAAQYVHPDDLDRVVSEMRAILEHEDGGTVLFRVVTRDGRLLSTETRCAVIRGASGARLGLRGVTMDISHRRRAEEEMIRARDEAEAANRSKDQFLAVLSHELRTPLTPVLAVTSVLEADERISPDQRPLIEMIRRNIELEARLIDDLLDLTRIAKGKLALNPETIDVHELANSVVAICRSDLQSKRLNLILDLKARDHFVRADPARMQQVLWNLIKNGVKFTPEGGRITLRTFNDRPGRIAIEISDTGLGIEPHILPRIFVAFDQGDLEVTRQFGGLGLGLAISHSLVEMHGGTLTVRSEGRNMGSVFTVTMETVVRLREPGTTGGEGTIRVLIVDDHVETGKVMKLLLERRGYRVESAHSVKEAISVAGERDFDLLISDIGLPDGSGLELMKALAGRRIRGIALSGFGMEEDIARSREAGFAEHLIKPVSFQTLQETIARVLA